MHVPLQQLGIPEQRKVVENGVISGERHVVGQPRARQRDVDVVHQVAVLVHHAVVHVRRLLTVVEKQQFAAGVVDLRVCRNSPVERESPVPRFLAKGFGRERVDAVEVAALVEACQRGASVHDHVGAGRVLHPAARPPPVTFGQLRRLRQPGPQRLTRLILCEESFRADKPVAVERLSVPESDDMNHPVAVERVIKLQRRVQRILGVAQINTVDVAGNLTCDRHKIVRGPFRRLRPPRPGPVRVVVVLGQCRQELADDLNVHQRHPPRN